MTEPNETNQTNEEVNEELSTDELKGVSGGIRSIGETNNPIQKSPQGSGSSVKKRLEDLDGQVKEDSGFKTKGGSIF